MPRSAVAYPFGDCKICFDKATGVHYGVATCEGCKGFFKRSIDKHSKYRCFFGGSCQVNPNNRNRCKSCRFKKCLSLGMSMEAVKMGRIPKMDKDRALAEERIKNKMEISLKQHAKQVQGQVNHSEAYAHPSNNGLPTPLAPVGMGNPFFHHTEPQTCYQKQACLSQEGTYIQASENTNQAITSYTHPLAQGLHEPPNSSVHIKPYLKYPNLESHHQQLNNSRLTLNASTNGIRGDTYTNSCSFYYNEGSRLPEDNNISEFARHSHAIAAVQHKDRVYKDRPDDMNQGSCHLHITTHLSENSVNQTRFPSGIHPSSKFQSHMNDQFSPYQCIEPVLNTSMPTPDKKANGSFVTDSGYTTVSGGTKIHCPGVSTDSVETVDSIGTDFTQISSPSSDEAVPPNVVHLLIKNILEPGSLQQLKDSLTKKDDPIHIAGSKVKKEEIMKALLHYVDQKNRSSIYNEEDPLSSLQENISEKTAYINRFLQDCIENMTGCKNENISSRMSADSGISRGSHFSGSSAESCDELCNTDYNETPMDEDSSPGLGQKSMTLSGLSREFSDKKLVMKTLSNIKIVFFGLDSLHEKFKKLEEYKLKGLNFERHPLNMCHEATDENIKEQWAALFASIPEVNAKILEFSEKVPGFKGLSKEDRGILAKAGYYDIWLIMNTPLWHEGESYLWLPNGSYYSRWWMLHFLPKAMVDKMQKFVCDLQSCKPSLSVLAILCALRLILPDRKNIGCVKKVQVLHNHLLDVLHYELQEVNPTASYSTLPRLLSILPQLDDIAKEQEKVTSNFTPDQPPGKEIWLENSALEYQSLLNDSTRAPPSVSFPVAD